MNYKYSPDDYADILGVAEDLSLFYRLHEIYENDSSQTNRFALEKQGKDLFFTIKHRALEGSITGALAHDMREYIEELLDD